MTKYETIAGWKGESQRGKVIIAHDKNPGKISKIRRVLTGYRSKKRFIHPNYFTIKHQFSDFPRTSVWREKALSLFGL
jgi:hypothetical protein